MAGDAAGWRRDEGAREVRALYTGHIVSSPQLERSLSLRGAVALNLLDMIGVGPFITLPLLLGSMGGPQAMLGWMMGALLALCDGLVWAELGAALPGAGGTFHFLRKIFPGALGRYLSFLFLLQLLLSAPLSIASGAIGLSQYAGWLVPPLGARAGRSTVDGTRSVSIHTGWPTVLAMAAILLAVVLLFRRLRHVERISLVLSGVVLGTIGLVVVSALASPAGHLGRALVLPRGAFTPDAQFFSGLAAAMLVATYDYWGYYNVTFLGAEVRDPGRTIPRAIVGSILLCAVLYLALTVSVLSVLPWQGITGGGDAVANRAIISAFARAAWTPMVGEVWARRAGQGAALLVMLTAFASIFSLLLGYSRIPYAAAREGAFFAPFGRLHRTRQLPYVSLLTLAGVAMLCCFLSLAEVIAALVVIRILLQFLLQHVGVLYLRWSQPELPRPFRIWLYPWPPVLAILGFTYILAERPKSGSVLGLAVAVVGVGSALFLAGAGRRRRPSGEDA